MPNPLDNLEGTHCPKCGRGRMSEPVYGIDPLRGERLSYRCMRCGYVTHTRPRDHEEGAPPWLAQY